TAPELELDTASPAQEVERVVEKRGGFGMALIGGVVAASIGFIAGQGQWLNSVLPASMQSAPPVDLTELEQGQAEIAAGLAALQPQVEANKTPDFSAVETYVEAELQKISSQIPPVLESVALIEPQLKALEGRLLELEKRPITDAASPAAVAAYEAELASLQSSLVAQREEVQKMVAEAQALDAVSAEAMRIASAQTMLAQLRSSLDAGTAYSSVLNDLEGVGVTIPEQLAASADMGVATLTSLTSDFVPAARAALAAAREETAGSGSLLAYAQRHLGARSVTPRDGDDPDAILSRAEAAIAAGQLDDALVEIQALPGSARSVLLDWETAAKTRQDAVAAADALAHSLNAN
ncbi:hypothetical protein DL239_06760, partial [Sedimentitalea sp. CY04]